ncbi:MAG: hypothetical protein L0G99_14900 [Propionibacteriales bacterium]|nr:hypothetical protein [Propionibacteriales bacterium]
MDDTQHPARTAATALLKASPLGDNCFERAATDGDYDAFAANTTRIYRPRR